MNEPSNLNSTALSDECAIPSEADQTPRDSDSSLRISENPRLKSSNGWKTRNITCGEFEQRLRSHEEYRKKDDAEAFVPGAIMGDRRTIQAVIELCAFVFDLDRGEDIDVVRQTIKARGLLAYIYSTYSHMCAETEIKIDDYRKFVGSSEVTPSGLERFLAERKGFLDHLLNDVEVAESYRDTPNGPVCVAKHAPISKYRIVVPFEKPFTRRECFDRGLSQAEFEKQWKASYAAFANSLNIAWDQSCSDLARAFYYPSCKPKAPRFTEKIEGRLLKFDDIERDSPVAVGSIGALSSDDRKATAPFEDFNYQGFDLRAWVAQYGATFEIEAALKFCAPSILRSPRSDKPGVHIACPFEETHTEAGGHGTFVVNANQNEGREFGIHCCHDHCLTERGDGKKVDRLIFIKKMLEDGSLALDCLWNQEFGGGAISARVRSESLRSAALSDLRVADRDGHGIDLEIFHTNVIAKPNAFDFDLLNTLCRSQIGNDVTAKQLAEFIQSGQVTVANLIECSQENRANSDPYFMSLLGIAQKEAAGKLLSREVDVELSAVRTKFNVKQKDLEKDFKRAQRQVNSPVEQAKFGVLSREATALIQPYRDYVRDFAILNTGGKGVILNLRQPDLSKAIMGREDFDFLYRKDWIEVVADDGSVRTIYPAKEFLTKPPKNAHHYINGFVFKPSVTVAAGEYNLYRGLLVASDASGSYSMLFELIRDVWCQGDEQNTSWVMEWLMHIVAHPGERVGTSIAIRGSQGDGKSIVFEKLLGAILGDMMLRVVNHKLILGDFNEALIGKLVTVLEEAAFSGDKAAFDKMKELITGEKVLINPKFKAPISVDNFSRLVVVSNHDHFLHMERDDRRYTVLESSSAWQGTDKFDRLVDQWSNGGAARFVHDALNHSFNCLDDGKKLVISTNRKTAAAVRQRALSRSALEMCVVDIVLHGFKDQRGIDVQISVENGYQTLRSWELDEPLEMPSRDIESYVKSWLAAFESSANRNAATLHTIIETLDRYVGQTIIVRPKGPTDPATQKRPQLGTRRRLPPRRKALEHALDVSLITDEEYESALPADTVATHDLELPIGAISIVEPFVAQPAANDQFGECRFDITFDTNQKAWQTGVDNAAPSKRAASSDSTRRTGR